MADSVKVKWIYPPNLDGNSIPDGQGHRRVKIQLTGQSDGTGESRVQKLDISDLQTIDGSVPARTVVEEISWSISGYDNILLEWDRDPYAEIAQLADHGEQNHYRDGGIVDPGGTRTGDILLTSTGASALDSYTIDLTVRLKS